MSHVLLLGAGFSRNWGGWLANEAFEYLLGSNEIQNDLYLRNLLWKCQDSNDGFESALAQLQQEFNRNRSNETYRHLNNLHTVLDKMFEHMNHGLKNQRFEFQEDRGQQVSTFLARFDAIFTLNQDLLLEMHYVNQFELNDTQQPRRYGCSLPGMRSYPNPEHHIPANWSHYNWSSVAQVDFKIDPDSQPIFKLHGSSNWRSQQGSSPLLIMGGNKATSISVHPILKWYYDEFEKHLTQPNTRLMVIGYSFRDQHITDVIERAVANHDLKFYVIDPLGSGLAANLNKTKNTTIKVPDSLEGTFSNGLIGASRRSLREIFGNDQVEHQKVLRFFN